MSSETVKVPFYSISGFNECQWYRRALCIGQDFVANQPDQPFDMSNNQSDNQPMVASHTFERSKFRDHLVSLKREDQVDIGDHFSCPLVLEGHCLVDPVDLSIKQCSTDRLIGGYTEFAKMLKQRYGFESTQCGKTPSQYGGSC